MTTDKVPKTVVLDGELSSGPIRMVGFTKGAGMIASEHGHHAGSRRGRRLRLSFRSCRKR